MTELLIRGIVAPLGSEPDRPWKELREEIMRRITLVGVAAILLIVGSVLEAVAQNIKVGAVVPLTGRYAAGGAQNKAGYEIAVEHINAAGGVSVGGKKMRLELTLLDDESDPTKTV
ncbi:MAG: ABC transporter substrate-binding protein, partial [Deltaproteobacteria bacterium]|nr:ABC transporter substrate-binding protein [Deltaproteobacteria bacterium]